MLAKPAGTDKAKGLVADQNRGANMRIKGGNDRLREISRRSPQF
jgi:hypothetical protein